MVSSSSLAIRIILSSACAAKILFLCVCEQTILSFAMDLRGNNVGYRHRIITCTHFQQMIEQAQCERERGVSMCTQNLQILREQFVNFYKVRNELA
jgi:hypothetical protein